METIESKLRNELEHRAFLAKIECKYNPTRFLQMLNQYGAKETVKRLISEQASDGYTRLYLEGRLDLSIEATILEEPYRQLFSKEELEICREKLLASGFEVNK